MTSARPSKLASSLLALAALAASVLVAPTCRAEAATTNAVAAEALFLEAKALLRDGDAAAACPKLAESQRLDPGTGTLLMLALCHERVGRTATAWSEFREALVRARTEQRADREDLARRHIASLEPHLAYVNVVVPEEDAALPGFEVKGDGSVLTATSGTSSIAVDPGTHAVEAYAKGERLWAISVVIGTEPVSHEVIVPRLLASAPTPVAEPAPPPMKTLPAPVAPPPPSSHTLRNLAIGAGVVALAGVTVGAVFGARAMDQSSEAKRLCPAYPCAAGAESANDSAKSAATISNVAFAVGGAGLLGAVSLAILNSGSGPHGTPAASSAPPHVAGIAIGWRGEW
jgi:hypothetical protein